MLRWKSKFTHNQQKMSMLISFFVQQYNIINLILIKCPLEKVECRGTFHGGLLFSLRPRVGPHLPHHLLEGLLQELHPWKVLKALSDKEKFWVEIFSLHWSSSMYCSIWQVILMYSASTLRIYKERNLHQSKITKTL